MHDSMIKYALDSLVIVWKVKHADVSINHHNNDVTELSIE